MLGDVGSDRRYVRDQLTDDARTVEGLPETTIR